jgi:AmmeMemoRadiSam system protein B
MTSAVRPPAVAGRFYPRDPQILLADIRSFLGTESQAKPALGCIVPHAGYMYSGHVAGAVFAAIKIPPRCIILCPNHTGMGTPLSIMSQGSWQTPLGLVPVDQPLAEELKSRLALLREDSEAHHSEHAIEVELPFLQLREPRLTFVPIALGTSQPEVLTALGNAIAEVISPLGGVIIIASSDMNHYENDALTRVKDHKAIEQILALDAVGLYEAVKRERISMCGLGPAIAMITAVKGLGARSAELIRYATSGDVSGDRDTVVGYAGIIVR